MVSQELPFQHCREKLAVILKNLPKMTALLLFINLATVQIPLQDPQLIRLHLQTQYAHELRFLSKCGQYWGEFVLVLQVGYIKSNFHTPQEYAIVKSSK